MTNDWYNCQGVLCGFTDAVVKENYEFKDTLKAFDDFKNKKSLWSIVFRYAKVGIYILKAYSITKMHSFIFHEL